jgi:histone deacetylase 6
MTRMLMSLADGKIAVCLEGGYNLRSIAISALAVTRTLMGEPPGRVVTTVPTPSAIDTIEEVLRQQAKYWPCLFPKNPSDRLKKLGGERLHDIVRDYQAGWLWENLGMSSLFIAHSKASRSFKNQVLAT